MAVSINPMVFIGTFLIFLTGTGSGLRVVTQPQPFTVLTNELNISCIADKPTYKTIISIHIMRHIEDKLIASVNLKQEVKKADGFKDNFQVQGHIDTKSTTGFLTLIIDKPHRQNAGTYRCQMFVLDENVQIVEENVIGNVTYQEQDITGVITHIARKVSRLSTTVLKLNNTQHISFGDFQSQLKDHQARQKQEFDVLTDKMDRQTKQIEVLSKDNKQKQKQLDMLTAYIQRQNETIKEHESQLQSMAKQMVFHHPGWKYYAADQTFIKAFGTEESGKRLTWSKARESCQTYGGDLVQIHDEAKNNFVYDLFDGEQMWPWIGIKNTATRGIVFKYVDGSDLGSYHPWLPGQPDGETDKNHKCVMMSTSTSIHPRMWGDHPCSESYPYVCSVSSLNVL